MKILTYDNKKKKKMFSWNLIENYLQSENFYALKIKREDFLLLLLCVRWLEEYNREGLLA